MDSNTLHHSSEKEIKELIGLLCNDDGHRRKEAREKLVDIGESTLDYVKDLLDHEKHICRWEAMKVIEEIGSPQSIPIFLEALDDDKSDIRWIAAEGLIRTGKYSVRPLLNAVAENSDSVFILNGAHHVFYELDERDLLPKGFPADKLLPVLKNPGQEARLKVVVHSILRDLK